MKKYFLLVLLVSTFMFGLTGCKKKAFVGEWEVEAVVYKGKEYSIEDFLVALHDDEGLLLGNLDFEVENFKFEYKLNIYKDKTGRMGNDNDFTWEIDDDAFEGEFDYTSYLENYNLEGYLDGDKLKIEAKWIAKNSTVILIYIKK